MIDWVQTSSDLGSEAKGSVQTRYPDDMIYLNSLLRWGRRLDTTRCAVVGAIGPVVPKEWGEAKILTRVKTPAMKRTFQDLGDSRFSVRTTEELSIESGLDFVLYTVSNE